MSLAKAELWELENPPNQEARANPQTIDGTMREVQFNPASLRLGRRNVHDPGQNTGRPARQFNGNASDTYTLEFHFDTADEDGGGGEPVSVRERTAIVERYVQPGTRNATPPRLRFVWGDLIIDGVVESLDLEFDLFAANGYPLRAKATMTIKGQDSLREVVPETTSEAGRNQSRANDSGSGTPGSGSGGGPSEASALADESPAEFAARLGLDPSAWRGLGFDLDLGIEVGAGMSLTAGASVSFGANISASVGIGAHVGIDAGVDVSLAASFGLEADVSIKAGATAKFSGGASASLGAGFRLSAAGGVEAAIELQRGHEAAAAALHASAAFGGPTLSSGFVEAARPSMTPSSTGAGRSSAGGSLGPSAGGSLGPSAAGAPPAGPTQPQQSRTPLLHGGKRASGQVDAEPAPAPPRADTRAVSYGFGLPLRPQVTVPGRPGRTRPHEREQLDEPRVATRRAQAPWTALAPDDPGRRAADRIQQERRPQAGCNPCRCDPGVPWSIEDDPGGHS